MSAVFILQINNCCVYKQTVGTYQVSIKMYITNADQSVPALRSIFNIT